MSLSLNKSVVIIAGPTAIGKTELCIQLAKQFKTEIISADSRQFYKELKIGTASPTKEELKKVKHHFIGHISIHDYYNVSMFEQQAVALAENLLKKYDIVFLTGGSGLYIDTFCKGIDELPDPNPDIRLELKEIYENQGLEPLRFQLKNIDPEYYAIVDLANPKRIMRALEVYLSTGIKYSELRRNTSKKRSFNIIKLALNRERQELFNRINTRVDNMFALGLVEEAMRYSPLQHLNAMNTVGYKELFAHFDGKITLEQAKTDIKTNTRRYAKRQLTWFKKDTEMKWFHPEDNDGIVDYIYKRINCNDT